MKNVVAIIIALGTVAFTAPTLASGNASGKEGELYNGASNKTECENLPFGKWDDKTKICRKGESR
jgi:hypothetical protein